MADLTAFYRIKIQEEFDSRVGKNPRYSRNSFSRFLGVTPSYFSKLMKGKILLSLRLADKFSQRLKWSEELRREMILSVAEEQRCHGLYLLDPGLTECDPQLDEMNCNPKLG